jgi:hypothetical protein
MDKSNRTKVLNSIKNHTKYLENSSQQTMTLEELARKMIGGA